MSLVPRPWGRRVLGTDNTCGVGWGRQARGVLLPGWSSEGPEPNPCTSRCGPSWGGLPAELTSEALDKSV